MMALGKALDLCVWYAPQILAGIMMLIISVVIVMTLRSVGKMVARKLRTGHYTVPQYKLERG